MIESFWSKIISAKKISAFLTLFEKTENKLSSRMSLSQCNVADHGAILMREGPNERKNA